MKHVMNKNIIHNGKAYDKGSEIDKADENFKAFQEAGHIEEGEVVEQKGGPEVVHSQGERAQVVQEEKSEQPAKSAGKSKK